MALESLVFVLWCVWCTCTIRPVHLRFRSKCQYAILDIQGVGTSWTDIAIVSKESAQYGYTDTGPNGIKAFFSNHVCGEVCRKLGLTPLTPASPVFALMPANSHHFAMSPPRPLQTAPTTPDPPPPHTPPPQSRTHSTSSTPDRGSSATYTPGGRSSASSPMPKPVSVLSPLQSPPPQSPLPRNPLSLWKVRNGDSPGARRTLTPAGEPATPGSPTRPSAFPATYTPQDLRTPGASWRRNRSAPDLGVWQPHNPLASSPLTLPERIPHVPTSPSPGMPASAAATPERAATPTPPAPAAAVPEEKPPPAPAAATPERASPPAFDFPVRSSWEGRLSLSERPVEVATPQYSSALSHWGTAPQKEVAAAERDGRSPTKGALSPPHAFTRPLAAPSAEPTRLSTAPLNSDPQPKPTTGASGADAHPKPSTATGVPRLTAHVATASGSQPQDPTATRSQQPSPNPSARHSFSLPLSSLRYPVTEPSSGRSSPYLEQTPSTGVSRCQTPALSLNISNLDSYTNSSSTYIVSPRLQYGAQGVSQRSQRSSLSERPVEVATPQYSSALSHWGTAPQKEVAAAERDGRSPTKGALSPPHAFTRPLAAPSAEPTRLSTAPLNSDPQPKPTTGASGADAHPKPSTATGVPRLTAHVATASGSQPQDPTATRSQQPSPNPSARHSFSLPLSSLRYSVTEPSSGRSSPYLEQTPSTGVSRYQTPALSLNISNLDSYTNSSSTYIVSPRLQYGAQGVSQRSYMGSEQKVFYTPVPALNPWAVYMSPSKGPG